MKKRASVLHMLFGAILWKVPFLEARSCLERIEAHGLPLSYKELAAHHLAGGRITALVDGLIYAQGRGLKMAVTNAQARDLVASHTTKVSLTEHVQAFEAVGIRNLDGAPLDVTKVQRPDQAES